MFFWFGFLTILASILYFSFYPRNDPLQVIDKPIADSLTAPLIAQHMAALKDASIIVYGEISDVNNSHTINQKYILETKEVLNQDQSSLRYCGGSYPCFQVTEDAVNYYLPKGIKQNTDFKSYITCFSNDSGQPTDKCGCTNEGIEGEEKCTTDFLITIGEIPDEWDYYGKLAPRALAERLFLTKYTKDTNLPVTCGILDCSGNSSSEKEDFFPNGPCFIYTTRYQDVRVPNLRELLNLDINSSLGIMVCISRLSVTYKLKENPAEIIYP